MKNIQIKKISDEFEGGGTLLSAKTNNLKLDKLNKEFIKKLFFEKGLILFNNFKVNPKDFFNFTKKFTTHYSNDALRRKKRFDNKVLRNVDLGNKKVPLHSESSFTVTRPQIIWFMCITPPKINDGGETIICDGSKLWEKLSPSCKNFFKKEPVEYDVKINLDNKNQGIKKKWFLNYPGIYNEFLDLNKNIMTFKYKTFAVEKNYFNSKLFFCNHLLSVKDKDESQIKKVSYKSKPIPKKYFEEIKNTSEKITYSHIWKRNQIFMIDNHRFMHGRNKIFKKSKRDIINSQTLVANLL